MKKLLSLLIIIITFCFGSSLIKAQSITLAEVAAELKNGEGYANYLSFDYAVDFIQNQNSLQVKLSLGEDVDYYTFSFSENIISLVNEDIIPVKAIYTDEDYDLMQIYEYWFAEIYFATGRIIGISKEECQEFIDDGEGHTRELSLTTDGLILTSKNYAFIIEPDNNQISSKFFDVFKIDLDNPFGQGTPYAPPTPEPDSEPESEIIPEAEPRPALPPNPDTGRESSRYFIISGLTAITLINLAIHKRRNLFKI